ncbi:MAG TPA: pyridoxine 5'-phosphate synthase [Bacteroidota bacterium]|nr:pyridoxine 5'-phosphate synthase [Bacteroidota bacterium]
MKLSINIDHVATLRQARGESEPDPVEAAQACERAGADGIVCHLREDRRHINDRDLRLLRETVRTKLDLEMAATAEIMAIARATRPELATLVPERRAELTTEGGLDVRGNLAGVREAVARLKDAGIRVSLFVDPVAAQIDAAREAGTDTVEIHTGAYANAGTDAGRHALLEEIRAAARRARGLGLGVNAGHGLNYRNIVPFRSITDIDEVSIGHAVITRAVYVGLTEAVKEMLALVRPG